MITQRRALRDHHCVSATVDEPTAHDEITRALTSGVFQFAGFPKESILAVAVSDSLNTNSGVLDVHLGWVMVHPLPDAIVGGDSRLEEVPMDRAIVHRPDVHISLVGQVIGVLDVHESLVGVDLPREVEEVDEHHDQHEHPPESRERMPGVGARTAVISLEEQRSRAVPKRVLKGEGAPVLLEGLASLGGGFPLVRVEVVDETENAGDDEEGTEVDEPDFDAERMEKTERVVVDVVRILEEKFDASAHERIGEFDVSKTLFRDGDGSSSNVSFL